MRLRSRLVATGVVAGLASAFAFGGTATAAFPNFTDCPRGTPDIVGCLDVQSTGGSMTIKGFTVPIFDQLNIRGALRYDGASTTFVPPAGTNGFFGRPIQVPGGILGIDFPIPGNAVTATPQLAGTASQIGIDTATFTLRVPMKLKLTNPIIGSGCQIGSNSSPAWVTLILGTTSPPAPNTPISGRLGSVSFPTDGRVSWIQINGNRHVDNSFSIPGATNCGINLGLINALINLKLRLPSSAGNNTLIVENNLAQGGLF